jgi:hypothetical protein
MTKMTGPTFLHVKTSPNRIGKLWPCANITTCEDSVIVTELSWGKSGVNPALCRNGMGSKTQSPNALFA